MRRLLLLVLVLTLTLAGCSTRKNITTVPDDGFKTKYGWLIPQQPAELLLAEQGSPSALIGIEAASHKNFDRVIFKFEGKPNSKFNYGLKPQGKLSLPRTGAWLIIEFGASNRSFKMSEKPDMKLLKAVELVKDTTGSVIFALGLELSSDKSDRRPVRVSLRGNDLAFDIQH